MATTIDPQRAPFPSAVPAVGWQSFRVEMERLFDGQTRFGVAGSAATCDLARPLQPQAFTLPPER